VYPVHAPASERNAPQKVGSVSPFTHVRGAPHGVRPAWHDSRQLPLTQFCPAGQLVPGFEQSGIDAPQCWLLVSGSMQVLLQSAWLLAHESEQAPFWQMWPGLQVMPELMPWQLPVAPQ
jgi:hypothetical protein